MLVLQGVGCKIYTLHKSMYRPLTPNDKFSQILSVLIDFMQLNVDCCDILNCQEWIDKQECIPLRCVLPTPVAVRGVCPMHAGFHPPPVWAWRPPPPPRCGPGELPLRCGPGDPPAIPSTPPGCGPGDPPGDLQFMLGYHMQGMLGYQPPPPRQNERHV